MAGNMTGASAEKIPSWSECLLLPQLSEIKGELKALRTEVGATNSRVTSLEESVNGRIDSLRNELKSDLGRVEGTLSARLSAVEQKLDVVREVDDLKGQVALLRAA